VPQTPVATLVRARNIALQQGLHYVYTGNVHNIEGDTTFCPSCKAPLIVRDWYQVINYRLTASGRCPDCGTAAAGRFDATCGYFGRHRIPVMLG
jgi:pyruvate formate lyase activating enzyme